MEAKTREAHHMGGDTHNTMAAIQAAAGVSPDKISLAIRTILLVLVFVFAGYVMLSQLDHLRHHGIDGLNLTRRFFGVVFVVTLTTILVYGV